MKEGHLGKRFCRRDISGGKRIFTPQNYISWDSCFLQSSPHTHNYGRTANKQINKRRLGLSHEHLRLLICIIFYVIKKEKDIGYLKWLNN